PDPRPRAPTAPSAPARSRAVGPAPATGARAPAVGADPGPQVRLEGRRLRRSRRGGRRGPLAERMLGVVTNLSEEIAEMVVVQPVAHRLTVPTRGDETQVTQDP